MYIFNGGAIFYRRKEKPSFNVYQNHINLFTKIEVKIFTKCIIFDLVQQYCNNSVALMLSLRKIKLLWLFGGFKAKFFLFGWGKLLLSVL